MCDGNKEARQTWWARKRCKSSKKSKHQCTREKSSLTSTESKWHTWDVWNPTDETCEASKVITRTCWANDRSGNLESQQLRCVQEIKNFAKRQKQVKHMKCRNIWESHVRRKLTIMPSVVRKQRNEFVCTQATKRSLNAELFCHIDNTWKLRTCCARKNRKTWIIANIQKMVNKKTPYTVSFSSLNTFVHKTNYESVTNPSHRWVFGFLFLH